MDFQSIFFLFFVALSSLAALPILFASRRLVVVPSCLVDPSHDGDSNEPPAGAREDPPEQQPAVPVATSQDLTTDATTTSSHQLENGIPEEAQTSSTELPKLKGCLKTGLRPRLSVAWDPALDKPRRSCLKGTRQASGLRAAPHHLTWAPSTFSPFVPRLAPPPFIPAGYVPHFQFPLFPEEPKDIFWDLRPLST